MIIYKLKSYNDSSDELNIGFEVNIKKGDELPRYVNFEYIPPKKYQTKEGVKELQVLKFKNITPEREKIIDKVLEIIEQFDENWTISGILEQFSEYFSKSDEDLLLSKLIGDIGETVFILKLQELNIDYQKYYQKDENSLYDFAFKRSYVDVKTTSENKRIINITRRQIENSKNLWLFVCEINKLNGRLNILDLLNRIKIKSNIIQKRLKYWESKLTNSDKKNLILSWTVDFDKVKCYFISNDALPEIEIKKEAGLIDISLKLSTTNCKKLPVESIKKII